MSAVGAEDVVQLAVQVLDAAAEAARPYGAKIMQGVDGERAHGHDVFSWTVKLSPGASPALRAAALLHDVDRLVNPALAGGFRGDRSGPAYEQHKRAHAARSAAYASSQLSARGAAAADVERVRFLVAHHDDTGPEVESLGDADLDVLVAADVLAFFTSFAQRILELEGEARLADKVAFMVAKAPASARRLLEELRLADPALERVKAAALARR